MIASRPAGNGTCCGHHHLCGKRPTIEACLEQEELVTCAAGCSAALHDNAVTFVLKRSHIVNRQDQRLSIQKQWIAADQIGDNIPVCISLKLDVDTTLQSVCS